MTKQVYRVRNWKEYNEALIQRGSITWWFNEECFEQWYVSQKSGKPGRPPKYSDMAIECGLTLKGLFKLTFRSTQGFIKSLMNLLKIELEVPDYTLLCKRQKTLSVDLKRSTKQDEPLHILVDTTGLKVYGEGEWKVRQHGWMKHRLWRKLHLAVNGESQEIEAFELTDLGTQDCEGVPLLLEKLDGSMGSWKGDGAYDRFLCYEAAEQRGFELITPPQRNAKLSKERRRNRKKASLGAVKKRDDVIERVRKIGRQEWKIETGYHRRSLAETMMFRVKTLLGNRLSTRKLEHQKVEAAVWCNIINKMTALGMPESVAVS
jgi:hypothetical protein